MHGWFAAAQVAGTKGLNGKLKLVKASAFLCSAKPGCRLSFVPPTEQGVRFAEVRGIEPSGPDACLVDVLGVDDAEEAHVLVGSTVLLEGDTPQAGSPQAMASLVGYALQDADGELLGTVERVDEDRLQPLLHVLSKGTGATFLVPFVEDLVVSIDEESGVLVMDVPSGLVSL